MANRLARLAKAGPAVGNAPPYLIVKARDRFWMHWLHPESRVNGYSALARADVAAGLWDSQSEWFPVTRESCPTCGHPAPLCILCATEAIYFLDTERPVVPVYLCTECGERLDADLGLYACCDGCGCDHWR